MMNCDKARLLLSEYIDGTLEPGLKKEIDDFLEKDTECSSIFSNAMLVRNKLNSLPKVLPSEEFEVNLRNRIISYNQGNEKRTVFNKKGWSLVFSGAVLVSALYMFIFTDIGNQQKVTGTDEILPSSTIRNAKPLNIVDDNDIIDQKPQTESVSTTDTVRNIPQKVDDQKIHLTGEGK